MAIENCEIPNFANAYVPDQVRTLSQVGTSSYMAYAVQELTQGVPIWLKKVLLGPIVN